MSNMFSPLWIIHILYLYYHHMLYIDVHTDILYHLHQRAVNKMSSAFCSWVYIMLYPFNNSYGMCLSVEIACEACQTLSVFYTIWILTAVCKKYKLWELTAFNYSYLQSFSVRRFGNFCGQLIAINLVLFVTLKSIKANCWMPIWWW